MIKDVPFRLSVESAPSMSPHLLLSGHSQAKNKPACQLIAFHVDVELPLV